MPEGRGSGATAGHRPGTNVSRLSPILIAGPRVALRPMGDEDIAAIEPWYAEATAAARGQPASDARTVRRPRSAGLGPSLDRGRAGALPYELDAAQADPEGGLLVIALRDDPTPIGLLDYRANDPAAGWLTVGFIAVSRPLRGRGYGSEAVRLLEAEAARRRRVASFRANVDVGNGLGLYFWLRLGYGPGEPAADAQGRNVLPMIREPV